MLGGTTVKKSGLFFLVLAILALPEFFFGQQRVLDVPYVPTNPKVVAEMLQMAGVGRNDILYDLGCGDGRIVITAAQMYGTHGIGIDLNPERIKESRENAAKSNVTGLVKFIEGDLFQADFHEASVVSLYLLTSVNLRLRPKLFEELRPGSRVVSHDFAMGEWEPDQSKSVTVDGYTHNIYFWTIPVNASGTWEWTFSEGGRSASFRLDIDQQFQHLKGVLKENGVVLPLMNLQIVGDAIKLTAERDDHGKKVTMVFEGRVVREDIQGTFAVSGGGPAARSPWKAKREIASMKRIDVGNEIH